MIIDEFPGSTADSRSFAPAPPAVPRVAGTGFTTVGSIYKSRFSPDKPAILFKGQTVTYAQLNDRVITFANYLRDIGVRPGDRVMLDLGNCPEFLYTYLSVVRNAAIIVPVNPMLTLRELAYVAKDSGAKYLMIGAEVLASHKLTAETVAGELGVRVLVSGPELFSEIAQASREDFDFAPDENAISTFLYTSGTTGNPKAAMLSHKNLVSNAEQVSSHWQITNADSIMCVLPMFHVFSCTLCVLLPLEIGCTINIVEAFSPKTVLSELRDNEITVFMGVPAMLMVMTDVMKKENLHFPKLRFVVYGGASAPAKLFNTLLELGLVPTEGYGLTESSPVLLANPVGKGRLLSCGKPPVGVECRIVDENDNDVPVGEVGELVGRGPNVMQGYYKRTEETATALRNGWLHTGDLAKKDADDYYYIVDRKKDIVIVSGLNVYPREIEEVLYKHPDVKDAAVIGVPDKLRGEAVVAYIVQKDPEKKLRHMEVLFWLRKYLAAYKLPRRICVLESMPRNSTGKILKRVLREQAQREQR